MKVYVCYTIGWDGIEEILLVTDSQETADDYIKSQDYLLYKAMTLNEVSDEEK